MRFLLLNIIIFNFVVSVVLSQNSNDVIIEQIDQRDMYSKTFLKNHTITFKEISGGPIHYQEGVQWLPIDCSIMSTGDVLFPFQNSTNVIKSSFPQEIGSSKLIRYEINGSEISVNSIKKLVSFSELGGFTIHDELILPNQAIADSGSITYENIYQGISDRFEIGNATIKNKFILEQLPASFIASTSSYLGFEEQIFLPVGWGMSGVGTDNDNLSNGPIQITNEQNEVVLLIPSPVFYDSGIEPTDGSSLIEGKFHISLSNGVWKLSTLVPTAWLQDSNRVFPVVLDPTVTINGTTGGWQSQNNYIDSDGFIFVGVCCGNLEHRGWIKFNTTGIPDNSCVTDVQLRVYVNGVGASTPELTHVEDVTGQFGPYGAINPAAYADIGNGYYTSFTIGGTGNYGYYDLGPNADALLQSQLVGNWFQVGLMFDNEPSVNWKRITGTLSSIIVVYSVPPCSSLPVGLTDFEVDCVDQEARLKWTTASEQQSAYFSISRSYDGVKFDDVQQIPAAGNSQDIKNYSWQDPLQSERIAYYRLSQTDLDGKVVSYPHLSIKPCVKSDFTAYVDGFGQIHIEGEKIQEILLRDDLGRIIPHTTLNADSKGFIVYAKLHSGIYQVSAILDDGTINNSRIFID